MKISRMGKRDVKNSIGSYINSRDEIKDARRQNLPNKRNGVKRQKIISGKIYTIGDTHIEVKIENGKFYHMSINEWIEVPMPTGNLKCHHMKN